MQRDIFESSLRTSRDLAGIFECDSAGGYFYLFDLTKESGQHARAVICVNSTDADIQESDVSIKWNKSEDVVGLYIRGSLWAAFDERASKYGGNYTSTGTPDIPGRLISEFI